MSIARLPVDKPAGVLRRLDGTGVPALLARLILGGLFIYMGVVKADAPATFLKQVREYHLVPENAHTALTLIAAVLPWLEVFCGVLVVLGVAVRGTSLLLLLMLVAFTVAVVLRAFAIQGEKHLPFCAIKFDCGCGGGEVFVCRKVLENTGLILLSLLLLWSRPAVKWLTVCWRVRPAADPAPAVARGRPHK